MPHPCLAVFPLALDFMYNRPIQITEANVLPLVRLSGELMMRELFLEAGEFLAQHITVDNAPKVLDEAITLELETVMATALALMAVEFQVYADDDEGALGAAFDRLDIRLIVEILRHDRLQVHWESVTPTCPNTPYYA